MCVCRVQVERSKLNRSLLLFCNLHNNNWDINSFLHYQVVHVCVKKNCAIFVSWCVCTHLERNIFTLLQFDCAWVSKNFKIIKIKSEIRLSNNHIGSAILNFENVILDSDSMTSKTYFWYKRFFSPDDEGIKKNWHKKVTNRNFPNPFKMCEFCFVF